MRKSTLLIALLLFAAASTLHAQEIFDAVKANDLSTVKRLITKDLSLVNQKDNYDNTLLHIAADSGYVKIAEYLLGEGADISTKNAEGNTPLHLAALFGHVGVSELFIQNKADLNAVNVQLYTPLHSAVFNGQDDLSRLCIEKGVDIER
ncbi:MAG: ankyrin repeat domain-containing protein [candidate division Zixibacteria bacterium]